MILRLLRDHLLYPMNQKGNTTHVFLSAVKNLSPAIMHLMMHYQPAAGMQVGERYICTYTPISNTREIISWM